jgi:hypothetical protein
MLMSLVAFLVLGCDIFEIFEPFRLVEGRPNRDGHDSTGTHTLG